MVHTPKHGRINDETPLAPWKNAKKRIQKQGGRAVTTRKANKEGWVYTRKKKQAATAVGSQAGGRGPTHSPWGEETSRRPPSHALAGTAGASREAWPPSARRVTSTNNKKRQGNSNNNNKWASVRKLMVRPQCSQQNKYRPRFTRGGRHKPARNSATAVCNTCYTASWKSWY